MGGTHGTHGKNGMMERLNGLGVISRPSGMKGMIAMRDWTRITNDLNQRILRRTRQKRNEDTCKGHTDGWIL